MGKITVEECVVDGVVIEGLKVITPQVHGDNRGYFIETYNYNDFREAGIDHVFVQDNQSASRRGVLRGLHFQKEYPQDKLVRVVRGKCSTWLWICGKAQRHTENGLVSCCRRRTRNSFLSPRILPMAFWSCRSMRSSATRSRTFTTRMTRAGCCGAIPISGSSGRSRKAWSRSLPTGIRNGAV